MFVIEVGGANEALAAGVDYLLSHGVAEESRNGPVLVAPGPVTTVYKEPRERVLLSPTRDANPFFHLLGDALWCLSGSNNITWPSFFNKRYADYSDNGVTQHGAYGVRWQSWFRLANHISPIGSEYDQLDAVATELREKPASRQAVLTMWDPMIDLRHEGKDIPCNTQVYFDRRNDVLNMTVLCRSNDVIWGAYGANVVQFSVLQEYLAAKIGVPIGVYRQMSNNFHIYTKIFDKDKLKAIIDESDKATDRLAELPDGPLSIIEDPAAWDKDLHVFMAKRASKENSYTEPFFLETAEPMYEAWIFHKIKNYTEALKVAENIAAPDWRWACVEWLERRKAKHESKEI